MCVQAWGLMLQAPLPNSFHSSGRAWHLRTKSLGLRGRKRWEVLLIDSFLWQTFIEQLLYCGGWNEVLVHLGLSLVLDG